QHIQPRTPRDKFKQSVIQLFFFIQLVRAHMSREIREYLFPFFLPFPGGILFLQFPVDMQLPRVIFQNQLP
ncbi:hypothetical protein DK853_51485, partial [Klebsiella oxytoca]